MVDDPSNEVLFESRTTPPALSRSNTHGFTARGKSVPVARVKSAWSKDDLHYRLEFNLPASKFTDHVRAVRSVMASVSEDLSRPLEWIASSTQRAASWRAQVLLRGKDKEGIDLEPGDTYRRDGLAFRVGLERERLAPKLSDKTTSTEFTNPVRYHSPEFTSLKEPLLGLLHNRWQQDTQGRYSVVTVSANEALHHVQARTGEFADAARQSGVLISPNARHGAVVQSLGAHRATDLTRVRAMTWLDRLVTKDDAGKELYIKGDRLIRSLISQRRQWLLREGYAKVSLYGGRLAWRPGAVAKLFGAEANDFGLSNPSHLTRNLLVEVAHGHPPTISGYLLGEVSMYSGRYAIIRTTSGNFAAPVRAITSNNKGVVTAAVRETELVQAIRTSVRQAHAVRSRSRVGVELG